MPIEYNLYIQHLKKNKTFNMWYDHNCWEKILKVERNSILNCPQLTIPKKILGLGLGCKYVASYFALSIGYEQNWTLIYRVENSQKILSEFLKNQKLLEFNWIPWFLLPMD